MRLKKLFAGKGARDVEEIMASLIKDIEDLQKSKQNIMEILANNEKRLKKSIQGVELVRFNPFKEAGGNQSFAIGILNEEGDGIVLSSLYSRERMSIFAKPIKKLSSEFELTHEEKEVVKKATI